MSFVQLEIGMPKSLRLLLDSEIWHTFRASQVISDGSGCLFIGCVRCKLYAWSPVIHLPINTEIPIATRSKDSDFMPLEQMCFPYMRRVIAKTTP